MLFVLVNYIARSLMWNMVQEKDIILEGETKMQSFTWPDCDLCVFILSAVYEGQHPLQQRDKATTKVQIDFTCSKDCTSNKKRFIFCGHYSRDKWSKSADRTGVKHSDRILARMYDYYILACVH